MRPGRGAVALEIAAFSHCCLFGQTLSVTGCEKDGSGGFYNTEDYRQWAQKSIYTAV